jgi:hypothetical protein
MITNHGEKKIVLITSGCKPALVQQVLPAPQKTSLESLDKVYIQFAELPRLVHFTKPLLLKQNYHISKSH